jgi:hypothetical protein
VTTPTVADTINRYVEHLGRGSADGLTALYTSDATVEDPVGTDVRYGHLDAGVLGRPEQPLIGVCRSATVVG